MRVSPFCIVQAFPSPTVNSVASVQSEGGWAKPSAMVSTSLESDFSSISLSDSGMMDFSVKMYNTVGGQVSQPT